MDDDENIIEERRQMSKEQRAERRHLWREQKAQRLESQRGYQEIIRTSVFSLSRSPEKCQIFCKPIGAVCVRLLEKLEALTDKTRLCCRDLIHQLMQNNRYVDFLSHSRITMAAALAYIVCILCECRRSQWRIAQISHISEVTIRHIYKRLARTLAGGLKE